MSVGNALGANITYREPMARWVSSRDESETKNGGNAMSGEAMVHRVLTLQEVSRYLRVHPSTVYRLLRRHQLPAFKVGSDWRFNLGAIDRWCKEMEQKVAVAPQPDPAPSTADSAWVTARVAPGARPLKRSKASG